MQVYLWLFLQEYIKDSRKATFPASLLLCCAFRDMLAHELLEAFHMFLWYRFTMQISNFGFFLVFLVCVTISVFVSITARAER